QFIAGDDQTNTGKIGGELPLDHRRRHVDHKQIEHRDEAFARSVGPTDFTRAATGIAFERLARMLGFRASAGCPLSPPNAWG
ncbi:hypothetical protein ISX56_34970, partial [Serratia ureilytica]|nr:hypothetical protein [Serratia ureilytica]